MQVPSYTQEISLRVYQQEIIENSRKSLGKGHKRIVVQAPTGTGKTRTASAIIQSALNKGRTALFIVERRDLVYQSSAVFESFGMRNDIIMAGEDYGSYWPLKVASKDTLYHRGIKGGRMPMPPADVIVIDEAHLSLSESWKSILDYYRSSVVIGLTATPAGPRGRGLGEIYEDIVSSWPVQQFIDEGYLVPVRYFAPTDPDLNGVKIDHKTGDYAIGGEKGLAKQFDQPELVGDIYQNWKRIAGDRSTVVFGCNRKHAQHLCHEFLSHGVSAEYVDGDTPVELRKEIFERIKSGKTQVLTNVYVATYGLDLPPLECAVLARATKDIRMYLQTVGRILRPSPETGKVDALVIDHAGVIKEHGYITDPIPWSLDGKETVYERKERIQKKKTEQGERTPKDIKCCKCSAVFRGRRDCPNCGFTAIPRGEPIPVIEAELQEIKRSDESLQKKRNREVGYEAKAWFYGQLKQYAKDHGYKPGWSIHKYEARYGVLPWDKRVKDAPPCPVTKNVANWIKHEQIRYAKKRAAA